MLGAAPRLGTDDELGERPQVVAAHESAGHGVGVRHDRRLAGARPLERRLRIRLGRPQQAGQLAEHAGHGHALT